MAQEKRHIPHREGPAHDRRFCARPKSGIILAAPHAPKSAESARARVEATRWHRAGTLMLPNTARKPYRYPANTGLSRCESVRLRPCRPPRGPAAANPMHQVRVRRLPPLCRGHGARRCRLQPLSARRRGRDRAALVRARRGAATARPRARRGAAARGGAHRRDPVHRLHAVHPGVSGRRDRGCAQADAHRAGGLVHRLRSLRGALPRRLHRDDSRHRRAHGVGRVVAAPGRCRARPLCGAPRAAGARA